MAEMKRMGYKPSEQPVTRGMFSQPHTKEPVLMDRQLNQRDPVPMVGKAVSVSPNIKAKNNRNDRTVDVEPDCDYDRYSSGDMGKM